MENISIRPSKELRNNYAVISALAKVNPVAITVNGKEDVIVTGHEKYMEQQRYISDLEERLEIYNRLAQAEDDVRLGRVSPADDVFADVLKSLDELA